MLALALTTLTCFVSFISLSFTLSILSPIVSIIALNKITMRKKNKIFINSSFYDIQFCLSISVPIVDAICFWLRTMWDRVSSPLSWSNIRRSWCANSCWLLTFSVNSFSWIASRPFSEKSIKKSLVKKKTIYRIRSNFANHLNLNS